MGRRGRRPGHELQVGACLVAGRQEILRRGPLVGRHRRRLLHCRLGRPGNRRGPGHRRRQVPVARDPGPGAGVPAQEPDPGRWRNGGDHAVGAMGTRRYGVVP